MAVHEYQILRYFVYLIHCLQTLYESGYLLIQNGFLILKSIRFTTPFVSKRFNTVLFLILLRYRYRPVTVPLPKITNFTDGYQG